MVEHYISESTALPDTGQTIVEHLWHLLFLFPPLPQQVFHLKAKVFPDFSTALSGLINRKVKFGHLLEYYQWNT